MKIVDMHGRRLPVIGLDFETYYEAGRGKKYTLSNNKMTTTVYVRSPKFKAHGVSLRFPDDKQAWWVSHCDLNDVLRSIDWENYAVLCHNTAFDGFILSHHFGQVPAYYLDTLSMSRGEYSVHSPHALGQLGERLGLGGKIEGALAETANIYNLSKEMEDNFLLYGNRDVDLMWDIFDEMYYEQRFPEEELHIIHMTINAFCNPKLVVDHDLCREEAAEEISKKSTYVQQSGYKPAQLKSDKQFVQILEDKGIKVPMKQSPSAKKKGIKKMIPALAKNDLGFQALERNPVAYPLIQARKAVKSSIGETRAMRMIQHSYGTLPVMLHYCGAHTHRWSGGDKINLQNLPAGRKGQSDRLRRSIKAPPGYMVVVVDSGQIEARGAAWAVGETDLLNAFANPNRDPYKESAAKTYGVDIGAVAKDQRQVGKVTILSCGFGVWYETLANTIRSGSMGPPVDISDRDAKKSVLNFRRDNKKIVRMWKDLEGALIKMILGKTFELGPWEFHGTNVLMPNGLFMRYPRLTATEDEFGTWKDFRYLSRTGWKFIYGGLFFENLIQSTARTIVAQQAIEIAKRYYIASLTHDEVIYLAPKREAKAAYEFGIECLSTPLSWCDDIPLEAEGGYAPEYSK